MIFIHSHVTFIHHHVLLLRILRARAKLSPETPIMTYVTRAATNKL